MRVVANVELAVLMLYHRAADSQTAGQPDSRQSDRVGLMTGQRPNECQLDPDKVFAACQSFLVRPQICRQTTSNLPVPPLTNLPHWL